MKNSGNKDEKGFDWGFAVEVEGKSYLITWDDENPDPDFERYKVIGGQMEWKMRLTADENLNHYWMTYDSPPIPEGLVQAIGYRIEAKDAGFEL